MTLTELENKLLDIDLHIETVAKRNDDGTDLSLLAYALHHLVGVVTELAKQSKD